MERLRITVHLKFEEKKKSHKEKRVVKEDKRR